MRISLLFLALAGAVLAPATARAAATVAIRAERIRLGDLTPTAPRELASLDIGPAPAPGGRGVVSRDAVRAALTRAGADPRLADGLPARQAIERTRLELTTAQLEEAALAEVARDLPDGIRVAGWTGLRTVVLPEGPWRVEVSLQRLRRATAASVSVHSGDRLVTKLPVTLHLEGKARTATPRSDLARGSAITAADLEWKDLDLDALPRGAATRQEDLVGQELGSTARRGEPVARSALRPATVIERGRTVTLVAAGPRLRITQQVSAEEAGAVGDWIRVRNTTSGHQLRARVVSPAQVQIDLGGAP
jgi:flagella basal body P-ring formation protein FlgA